LVIAIDAQILSHSIITSQFTQILHQVIGEAVVVINHNDQGILS
jgi:hypothetical protein